MANIASAEKTYYDGFADELESKFQRLRHLTSHNPSSGSYHEEILRSVLRNFLTARYSVKTGFIYKNINEVSKQLDIIVIDETLPAAYIFQEGDFAVVLPQAVVAVIEVKTTLNNAQFKTSCENLASAKQFADLITPYPCIMFGYQYESYGATSMNEMRLSNMLKSVKIPDEVAPDMMLWFKDNFASMKFDHKKKIILRGDDFRAFKNTTPNNGWQLSVLLATIISACENFHLKSTGKVLVTKANDYLDWSVMDVSDNGYQFGMGEIKVGK